ncbi:retron Eco8 family effector endonuclease [Evansella halocellulosilytica]|uniref:retron Eco8 family effector endonuclease n=1 Tax=Evansella halocellulosilytica TaxID=2011013 RepID=UPI000BB851A3|nr:retron Eco8 family effector endonuclease [Evansella halocellulosilytica]
MLKKVKLANCKSIKKLDIKLDKNNCLIGQNGVGKTTFIKALQYFYDSLEGKKVDFTIFDKNNPYNEHTEIELIFDFNYFIKAHEGYSLKRAIGEIKQSEFMNYLGELITFVDENNMLAIKLYIDKDGNKEWTPRLSFELRKVLKTVYPFYYISVKNNEDTNWETLWEMVGDMAKLPRFNLEENLENFTQQHYGASFGKIIEIIKNKFDSNNIIINPFTNQEKFLNTIKLQLGGEKLTYKYKDLSFFSEGTNSFNYLQLYCSLVAKIAEQKLKIPLLLLDEPEVGLHPKFIDDLMDNLIRDENKNQTIIVTHAPRVLKNIMKKSQGYNILHATNKRNDYADITIINQFQDHREKNIISDEEASYYFSEQIVFVEGDTELELFNNKYLLTLFPFLRKVDFYSYDGDTVNISTIHPEIRNTKIPYLIIVDNDYIFEVNDVGTPVLKHGKKDFLNPLDNIKFKKQHEKEIFHFGENRKLYDIRTKINLLSSYKYSLNKYWCTVYGDYFITFKELIKDYCLKYKVFPVNTTIEGSLVNYNNINLFKDWLIEKHPHDQRYISDLFNISSNNETLTTTFRLIVNGKYDTLKNVMKDKKTNSFPENIRKSYLLIHRLRAKYDKTSGWVTEWLDYVFNKEINIHESREEQVEQFSIYFPELYDIIKNIYKLD